MDGREKLIEHVESADPKLHDALASPYRSSTVRSMDAAARALAEPTRRDILRLVRDDERTVSEIARHFPVSRPAISQHLRVLVEAELVTVRSAGTRRYYKARPEGMAELAEWMGEFWKTQEVGTRNG